MPASSQILCSLLRHCSLLMHILSYSPNKGNVFLLLHLQCLQQFRKFGQVMDPVIRVDIPVVGHLWIFLVPDGLKSYPDAS